MSDLISRSELLKRLEEWNTSDETDKALYNFTLRRIIEQPTAYSVDKVVEELEERQQEYLEGFVLHENNELYGVACGLGDAIKIVKQGGVGKLKERYPDGFDPDKSLHRKEGDI